MPRRCSGSPVKLARARRTCGCRLERSVGKARSAINAFSRRTRADLFAGRSRSEMTHVFESPGAALHPARSTRGSPAESRRLVSTASHAFYVLCCLKETRHRSRLRRRHLAREEAANEHRKRNDRGGRDRRGPALAPARGVWPRVHAPPGGRLGARVRTQGPRRRDRCVFFPRRLPRANDRSPRRKTRRVHDGRVSLLGCGGVVAFFSRDPPPTPTPLHYSDRVDFTFSSANADV